MAREPKPIRAAAHEVYNVAPGGSNGATLSINVMCGECRFEWGISAHMAALSQGFPIETCPNCSTVNYIPYSISGRNRA